MTSPTDDIHVRLPRKLKHLAQKILKANGMDFSSAIRLFFAHIAIRGTIPLPWITMNGLTPEFEESLLRQIRKPDVVATLKSKKDIEKFINGL